MRALVSLLAAPSSPLARPGAGRPTQPPVDAPVSDPFRPPATPYGPGNRGIEYDTGPASRSRRRRPARSPSPAHVAGRRYVTLLHADRVRTAYGPLARVDVQCRGRGRRRRASSARRQAGSCGRPGSATPTSTRRCSWPPRATATCTSSPRRRPAAPVRRGPRWPRAPPPGPSAARVEHLGGSWAPLLACSAGLTTPSGRQPSHCPGRPTVADRPLEASPCLRPGRSTEGKEGPWPPSSP